MGAGRAGVCGGEFFGFSRDSSVIWGESIEVFRGGGLSGGEPTGVGGVSGDSIETGVFGGDSCGGEEGEFRKKEGKFGGVLGEFVFALSGELSSWVSGQVT